MKVGIVGLGLIGGSYARALLPYGYEIYGIDVNEESLRYAEENKIIKKGYLDAKDILKELDVVFICLYPSQIQSFFQKYMMFFKSGAVISDVSGIKRKVIDAYEMYRRDDVDFVAAHPIAGKEKSGVRHSDASIFQGANFIITKSTYNLDESIHLIETLAKQMGFKKVTIMSDKDHDETISFTSQLTHILAVALMNSDQDHYHTKEMIGDSFRDLTRIANINESLWSELFIQNRYFLLNSITHFEDILDRIKIALNSKDQETLQALMKEATKRRRSLDE